MADSTRENIAVELLAWHTTGLRIAIWGGTAESAAFLETHGLDARRFPIVVDSDTASTGSVVPGTGQIVRFYEWLLDHPVDIIVIPCRHRAGDIVREIDAAHIPYEGILIPDSEGLVDFHAAEMVVA